MNEQQLRQWLVIERGGLDTACGNAMRDGMAGLTVHDFTGANESLNRLYADPNAGIPMPGGDCDYALNGIGALYTGHWHGKRVHDALSVLFPLLPMLAGQPLHIIDVGAGTGAVLWAWSLLARCANEIGEQLPVHTWHTMDFSGSMLAQNDRLWQWLCNAYPGIDLLVNRQQLVQGDWRHPPQLPQQATVLGSYLFSRVDINQPRQTANEFCNFLNGIQADRLVLWTKQNKRAVQDTVANQLAGWQNQTPANLFQCPLSGRMWGCVEAANNRSAQLNLQPDADWPRRFNWGKAPTDAVVTALRI